MSQQKFDALIIGAGAAGLMAALEIALTGRSVAIVEAKSICGGRIHSIPVRDNFHIELGAEFVHGKLPLTLELLKKAGLEKIEVEGSNWQKEDGQLQKQETFIDDLSEFKKKFEEVNQDMTVAAFLSNYFAEEKYAELRSGMQHYVEGYYAGDINKASTKALYKELTESDDENFRIVGGYKPVVDYLEAQCRQNNVSFFLGQSVQQVAWKKDDVQITTDNGVYASEKILVTVSIGVFQANAIRFSPALPQKTEAALQLGFGHVSKINLLFKDEFWKDKKLVGDKDLGEMNFLFSDEEIPTWWTQHPTNRPLLVGWLGGPKAEALKHVSQEEMKEKALQSLAAIFDLEFSLLNEKLQEACSYNWSTDPAFCGAYSYEVVNGEHYSKLLQEPAEETVFFAGEGLYNGTAIGTVEAALTNGRENAHKLIVSFSNQDIEK